MPFIHPERRLAGGGALNDFGDELTVLHSAGVRAVVSLLNIRSDAGVFESAGFSFLCLPVPDGGAPAFEQTDEFVQFVAAQRALQRPVAVHCEAGLGRTGAMLAAYLISEGESAAEAIAKVRTVESSAIETPRQIQFLEQYNERSQTFVAAGDLVAYNGISMRRDYAESLQETQRNVFYRVNDRVVPRIRFGDETYPMVTPGNGLCSCCYAASGQLHEPLCEREQCPVCKLQVMSCDCDILTDNAIAG
jgi:protein-tyrosine phosphatase